MKWIVPPVILLGFSATCVYSELIPRKPVAPPAPNPAAPVAPATPGAATPAPAGPSAAASLTPAEQKALQEQVAQLEKDLVKKRGGMHSSQLSVLREAMSGNEKAFNFWMDCKKSEDFEMKGKTAAEFAEWKRTQIKTTGINDAFCASLRLQLHFLMLAVLHSHAETPAQLGEVATGAAAYVESLAKFCEKEENLAKSIMASIINTAADPEEAVTAGNLQETLAQVREASAALGGDVLDSIFARHLELDGSVKPHSGGASNPGNLDEIYDRLILEPLRQKRDAAGIGAAWARRIEQTGRIAAATNVKEIEEKYQSVKVPAMKFAMYKDQWTSGQPKAAASSMIALLNAHPTHKDSNDWLRELKLLSESSGPGE